MTIEAPRVSPVVDLKGMVTKPWLYWFRNLLVQLNGVLGGSGTANKIAKWSDSDTLTDSIITDNGTTITLPSGGGVSEFFPTYDETTITISSGQITQILYKLSSLTLVTETRTYNAYGNISTRVFTGDVTGTWTYSYDATDNQTLTGVVKS